MPRAVAEHSDVTTQEYRIVRRKPSYNDCHCKYQKSSGLVASLIVTLLTVRV